MERLNETRISAFLTEPVGGAFQRKLATSQHAEHATSVIVGVDGNVHAVVGGSLLEGRAIVIPADTPYAAASHGPAVSYAIDPELSPQVAAYARARGPHVVVRAAFVDAVASHAHELAEPEVLAGIAQATQRELARAPAPAIDHRIARLLDDLRDPDVRRSNVLARTRLSPSHAQALFARNVGIPMRTYALWRRLLHALARVGPLDFTAAAHAAGFADLAHFSRTCRRMLGYSPTALRASLGDARRP